MYAAEAVHDGLKTLAHAIKQGNEGYDRAESSLINPAFGAGIAVVEFLKAGSWNAHANGQFTWLIPAVRANLITDQGAVAQIKALETQAGDLLQRGNDLYQQINRALQMNPAVIRSI